MYQKIKQTIVTVLVFLLLIRFGLLIADPLPLEGNADNALAIYKDWRDFINWIYLSTEMIEWPLTQAFNVLGMLWAPINSDNFPLTPSIQLMGWTVSLPWPASVKPWIQGGGIGNLFAGIFDWKSLMMVPILALIANYLDNIVDFFRNIVWNLLIEFSFTKKKQALYQEALEKRAMDLMKLNADYRNLTKEATNLKDKVITDELTEVYNKRFFIEKVRDEFEKAKKSQRQLAIIMLDIDHFKKLNDTYGHLMGDKVLKAVAQVAKNATPANCFCCRFGGEEFSIILPAKDASLSQQVAEKIKKEVEYLQFNEDPSLRVTISQGVCQVDFQAKDAKGLSQFDKMIKLADDELYRAKLEGRNRICTQQIN